MFRWLKRLLGDRGEGRQRSGSAGTAPIYAQAKRRSSGSVVVIDCETTGMTRDDRVVTLALVHANGLEFSGRMTHLVFNPERKCHPRAAAVHGWKDQVLRHQDVFADHAASIREAIGDDTTLVAHNLSFDLRFLDAEFERSCVAPLRGRGICTMQAARERWPGERASLDACAARLGLSRKGETHGALEDAFLAFNVYRHLNGAKGAVHPDNLPGPTNFRDPASLPLTDDDVAESLADALSGVGSGLAKRLVEAGYRSASDVYAAPDEELSRIKGLGPAKLARIREGASS